METQWYFDPDVADEPLHEISDKIKAAYLSTPDEIKPAQIIVEAAGIGDVCAEYLLTQGLPVVKSYKNQSLSKYKMSLLDRIFLQNPHKLAKLVAKLGKNKK